MKYLAGILAKMAESWKGQKLPPLTGAPLWPMGANIKWAPIGRAERWETLPVDDHTIEMVVLVIREK